MEIHLADKLSLAQFFGGVNLIIVCVQDDQTANSKFSESDLASFCL